MPQLLPSDLMRGAFEATTLNPLEAQRLRDESTRQQLAQMMMPSELQKNVLANRENAMRLNLLQEYLGLQAPEATEAGVQAPAITPPAQSPLVDLLRGRQMGPESPPAHPPMLAPEAAGIPPQGAALPAAPGMGAGAVPAPAPDRRQRNLIEMLTAMQDPKSLLDGKRGGLTAETFGKDLEYGVDAAGNIVPMQAGSSGRLIRLAFPEGVTGLAPGTYRQDLGDKIGIFDRTGALIATIPKDAPIPSGFRRTKDGGLEPIPGSEQEIKKEEAERERKKAALMEEKAFLSREDALDSMDDFLQTTSNIIKSPDLGLLFGPIAGRLRVGELTAKGARLANELSKLDSKTALNQLAKLKAQSAAGASGFGALSERELDVLIGSFTKISRGMKAADAKRELETIADNMNRVKLRLEFGSKLSRKQYRTIFNEQTGRSGMNPDEWNQYKFLQVQEAAEFNARNARNPSEEAP